MPSTRILLFLPYLAMYMFLPNSRHLLRSFQEPTSEAMTLLQSTVQVMGGNSVTDSTVTGTVTQTAGSLTTTGTVSILTRGTEQSREDITWSDCTDSNIYSSLASVRVTCGNSVALSMEETVTNQDAYSPASLLAHFANESDSSIQIIGTEVVNGINTTHLQISESFSTDTSLQAIAQYSVRDLWIDNTTALPVQLQYVQWTGQGSVDQHRAFLLQYSNYQSSGGFVYPSSIQVNLNGVPWRAITLTSVSLNTGLTDTNFPVDGGQIQ